MSDLMVIGFDDKHTAFEMRAALANCRRNTSSKWKTWWW